MADDDPGVDARPVLNSDGDCCAPYPEVDDTLVRETAEELRCISVRAHRIEVALVTIAAVLMVLVAAFTGFNTYRLRAVNRHLASLVQTVETNQGALQRFNETQAADNAESHIALVNNISCMADYFRSAASALRDETPLPAREVLDVCFRSAPPPQPPTPLPSDRGD